MIHRFAIAADVVVARVVISAGLACAVFASANWHCREKFPA